MAAKKQSTGEASLVDTKSVSATVDALGALSFTGEKLAPSAAKSAAQWLAGRQGLPGAYANMFAGFTSEYQAGIVVFTGERILSASARHILGEEACRALRLLAVRDAGVQSAIERACEGMAGCLKRDADGTRNTNPGRYCCGKCTVGLWRNLLAGSFDRREERLRKGVSHLRTLHNDAGQWQGMPFWYTVLALEEMPFPEAKRELEYAAPVLERAAARAPAKAKYAARRQQLAARALSRL